MTTIVKLKHLPFLAFALAVGVASGEGGIYLGRVEQSDLDKSTALLAHAGYYEMGTGEFTFGQPPIVLRPSSLITGDTIPQKAIPMPPKPFIPAHKPKPIATFSGEP